MSAPLDGSIRLSDPSELIAAVPYLLGFHPHDSVVLLAVHGTRLGLTLRADLVHTDQAPVLAEQMLLPMMRQRASGVALVVVGGVLNPAGEPPHRDLVTVVDGVFAAAGLPVVYTAWTAATAGGAPWRCYDDPSWAGTVADPAATPLAAATVAAGAVTFDSRDQLATLLAGAEPAVLARRAALLQAAEADHPMSAELRTRRLAQLEELHREAATGQPDLNDRTVVEVASALCDHRVRDACLQWCVGSGAVAAERLWLALMRGTPAPQRAEPAALLALVAYLRGDGALAGLALDAALRSWPDHSLSGLLRAALEGGLPPELLRVVVEDARKALRPSPRRLRSRPPQR